MQESLRGSDPDDFPAAPDFVARKEAGGFNPPAHVAEELLAIAFGERRGGPVVQWVHPAEA